MKKLALFLCLLLCFGLVTGCGDSEPAKSDAPTDAPTTAAPTETAFAYPEPDKIIALTFDDGPNDHMNTIIDVFEEYGGHASFFVIGKKVSGNTEVMARAVQEGHEIGNHSYNHVDITVLSEAEILNEVSMTQNAVKEATGVEPVWYRPPFLRSSDQTFSLIQMPHAGCLSSVGDGSNDNLAEDRHYRAINGAADGSIMLLHCNDITAEILPKILHDLKMQGYEFVTISELFARAGVDPVPNNDHYETTAAQ